MMIVSAKNFMAMTGHGIECLDHTKFSGKLLDGVTQKQRECLRKNGVGYSDLKYKGQAMAVLDVVFTRCDKKLATPGQLWALRQLGLNNISEFTRQEAEMILNKSNYIHPGLG